MITTSRFRSLDDLCSHLGGSRVIQRVLIANNGLAAVKGIRSLQQWLFEHTGNPHNIHFVVMASPECLRVNAEHIKLGDETVEVPAGRNSNNYANVDLIASVAHERRCDAVYVGWGHASENPLLSQKLNSVSSGRIVFMGPPSGPMRELGDKIASTIIAQSAGVPVLPWSGDHLRHEEGALPQDMFDKACLVDVAAAVAACTRIGYPVMIKASEGGGGKGIRKVFEESEVEDAYHAVTTEVPGSPVFAMKMATGVRHIEVQLLADEHGACIPLRTRECSVQRRQQKIIEEGPAYNLRDGVSQAMERAAVSLAKAVGYVGLGTVEYLYDDASGGFFFLELNPRLQVEHPVTEMVTGINLPAALLCVSMGIHLHRIPEVRSWLRLERYGESVPSDETIYSVPAMCHAMAVRVTAEDPDEGFQPCTGSVDEIQFRNTRECWGYFSLSSSGGVHEFSDSQFGHIFASGTSREEARRSMILGLRNIFIRGDVRTTVHYVRSLLDHPEFVACNVTTAWLDALLRHKYRATSGDVQNALVCAMVYRLNHAVEDNKRKYLSLFRAGHTPPIDLLSIDFTFRLVAESILYEVRGRKSAPHEWSLALNNSHIRVPYREFKDKGIQITIGERTVVAYVEEDSTGMRVSVNDETRTFGGDVDPTQLRSSVPGRLVRYLVENGAHVKDGQPFAEVEVMKMLLSLRSTINGKLNILTPPGATIPAGKVLATVEPDDHTLVKKASRYDGVWSVGASKCSKVNVLMSAVSRAKRVLDTLRSFLLGYAVADEEVEAVIANTLDGLSLVCLSSVSLSSLDCPFVAECNSNSAADKLATICSGIINAYTNVAQIYDKASRHETLSSLRINSDTQSPEELFTCDLANRSVQLPRLIRAVLSFVEKDRNLISKCQSSLTKLSSLESQANHALAFYGHHLLRVASLPTDEERRAEAARVLECGSCTESLGIDMICSFLDNRVPHLTPVAFEAFFRSLYPHSYEVNDVDVQKISSSAWQGFYTFKKHESTNIKHSGIVRRCSVEDICNLASEYNTTATQEVSEGVGRYVMYSSMHELDQEFPDFLASFLFSKNSVSSVSSMVPVVLFAFVFGGDSPAVPYADDFSAKMDRWRMILDTSSPKICEVTFVVLRNHGAPYFFTFREELSYREDQLIRHIPSTTAFLLELNRLQHYDLELVPTTNPKVHIYLGQERGSATAPVVGTPAKRLFARMHTGARHLDLPPGSSLSDIESGRLLLDVITALEAARAQKRLQSACMNHIFLSCDRDIQVDPAALVKTIHNLQHVYGKQLQALGVRELEIKFTVITEDVPVAYRVIATNTTGYFLDCALFAEVTDDSGLVVFKPIEINARPTSLRGISTATVVMSPSRRTRSPSIQKMDLELHPLSGLPVSTPYLPLSLREKQRLASQAANTTYVSDWPYLFETAVKMIRRANGRSHSEDPFPATELFPTVDYSSLVESQDGDEVGVKVWHCSAKLDGVNEFILVANDITYQIGSFSIVESKAFALAATRARELCIPLVYISANSGARLGLSSAVKKKIKVHHVNGRFQYVYLSAEDASELGSFVRCTVVRDPDSGETRHRVDDVIGDEKEHIGVENLHGSGLIAGEMSLCYETIPTFSIVSGRSVGIGAYLVRLGRRVVQTQDSPIILTGYNALNRVLGKEVYATNNQLGGPQIMLPNGVSHWSATDDMDAVQVCLRWLSYLPSRALLSAPPPKLSDPIDRTVTFSPNKDEQYDPRHLIEGDGVRLGLFDKDSFMEASRDWAKSVVCGRARLGGIPVGIIAVETRASRKYVPADPADPSSTSQVLPQAGQVWYPDSAHKTAEALADFRRERLPCFIIANWRGFSGGMRDMFDEVLKQGAKIVDNLRDYDRPVFVYIPPFGELRGGAWVVVDPAINADGMMEMYADVNARGGILEPSGVVEIKFRERDLLSLMRTSDKEWRQLKDRLTRDGVSATDLQSELSKKERSLKSTYEDAAVHFADLHDKPCRMEAVGVINGIVPWETSRAFFHARLHRRLVELEMASNLCATLGLTTAQAKSHICEWVQSEGVDVADDKAFTALLTKQDVFADKILRLKVTRAAERAREALATLRSLGQDGEDLLRDIQTNGH